MGWSVIFLGVSVLVGNHLLNLFLFILFLFARPQNLRLIFTEPHRSSKWTRQRRTFLVSCLTRWIYLSLPSGCLFPSSRTWPVRKHAKQRLPHAESHFDGPTNSFPPPLASYKPPEGTPGAFNPIHHPIRMPSTPQATLGPPQFNLTFNFSSRFLSAFSTPRAGSLSLSLSSGFSIMAFFRRIHFLRVLGAQSTPAFVERNQRAGEPNGERNNERTAGERVRRNNSEWASGSERQTLLGFRLWVSFAGSL